MHVSPGSMNPSLELETLTLLDIISTNTNEDDQAEDDQAEEDGATINTYKGDVSDISDGENTDDLLGDEAESDLDTQCQNIAQANQALLAELLNLRKELLGDYKLPETPLEPHAELQALENNERLSLQHYITWRNSNSMVLAYNEH